LVPIWRYVASGHIVGLAMGNASDWQWISALITCCLVAACGGESGRSVSSSSPVGLNGDTPQVVPPQVVVTPPGVTPNAAPTIGGRPHSSAIAGIAYEFVPQAVDPEGQALTFSVTGRPAWASFDALTGRLWGTPTGSDVGTHGGIVISVSDGVASATLATFSIQVTAGTTSAPGNQAPTISGTPDGAATIGQAYGFTPTASDPDGQALTFSIVNRPSWASFNTSTGRLGGTPTSADVGTYSGIVISVSDGSASASLPSFTLAIQQVQTGSATISWTPPTTNTDNSPLTNLSGYRIYYGTNASNLTQALDLPNPGISSGVVENLAAGKWYFAVTSYNSSNVESERSNVTSKTIG
jgi:hypothetical protein